VTTLSSGTEAREPTVVPAELVERLERETVFTFYLAADARWHDRQPLTARDVAFSFECYRNKHVRCDRKRAVFERIERLEVLDDRTLRFYFPRSYFLALAAFDETFTILPAHIYDLADPMRGATARVAGAEEQAREVNDGAANRAWIGLGPYKLVEWNSERIVARRVDAFFDESRAGLLDQITWRAIADNEAATAALLDGQLDFFDRLSVVDYFGERTHTPQFEARFYTGFFYTPALNITAWNTARPMLADARVRTALGLCFDWNVWLDGYYKGLAFRVTGEQMPFGSAYDRSLAPLAFDPRRARALLAEAGWIDRDGDGALDKDGAKLELDYLFPSGNEVSRAFGETFQARLGAIGVTLTPVARDNAALSEALKKREFDACALALALPFESDPEQLWHSKWAASPSANRSGLRDAEVDRLIEAVQVETDARARGALFMALQRRLYELQPVMFGAWAPHRFAMAKRVRGFQILAPDPGYSIRRWHVTDAPEQR
jgi:peptide/nickel transport system substrate-binding protein